MTAHDRLEVPDLILEQYRLNELPPQDADRVERLLREDATLQHRLEALDRSDAEIARQYPPAWMAERVRERLSRGSSVPVRPRDRVRRWGVPATIGAAAIVLVFMLPHPATAPFSRPATVTDDRSNQGAAAGAGGLSPLRPGHRNARRWRRRPAGRSPSARVHVRRTSVWRDRVDRRARSGHAPPASERRARGLARPRRSGAAGSGVRARRRAELGAVLFRHR